MIDNRKIDVTVFTPTYNREYTISKLYESLISQTNKNFEWVVVDDGSTDDTYGVIKKFIGENKLSIKYFKKDNEGKHLAINYGVKHAEGKMFFIVDSDDYLSSTAIEKIVEYEKTISNRNDFAGVVGLKGDFSRNPIKSPNARYTQEELKYMSGEILDATTVDYRYKMKITGDRAEVVYTDLLKKFLSPK